MKSTMQALLAAATQRGAGQSDPTTANLFIELQSQMARSGGMPGVVGPGITGLSLESIGAAETASVSTALTGLRTLLNTARQNVADKCDAKVDYVAESAALIAGLHAANPKAYLNKPVPGYAQLSQLARENVHVIGNTNADALDKRSYAAEAYDNQVNTQSAVFSMAYNLRGARQNEFGEAFYPTVVISPDNVGFMVSIKLLYVFEEVKRSVTGSLDNFGRKNVLRAQIDPEILTFDATRIYPVFRKAGSAAPTDNFTNFVEAIGTRDVLVEGKTVKTAPLAFGQSFSLLGLSQNDAQIARGNFDQTDAIGSSVVLENVYLAVSKTTGGNTVVEYFRIDTSKLPMADFHAAPQGNSRMLTLNFISNAPVFDANTKTTANATAANLADLSTNRVRLKLQASGNLTQDTAETNLMAGKVVVDSAWDADGVQLPLDAGPGATAKAVFANATLVAFDLKAFRTNTNKRSRGQLIDTQVMNYLYTVPLLPPITALRPVTEGDTNDGTLVSNLVQTTYQYTSNEAVRTLLESFSTLQAFTRPGASFAETPDILGVARHLVKAIALSEELPIETSVDSLTSTERAKDIESLMINKIRDMAARLIVESGYKVAADAVYDGSAPKPLVIVGTDPYIARYLTLSGDTRTLGDFLEVKIVETYDKRMKGKIVIGLGALSNYNSGVPAPLHNGNLAWKPELPVFVQVSRGDTTSFELSVHPSFRHVQNLPVMGMIEVSGIEDVIAGKVSINTAEQ